MEAPFEKPPLLRKNALGVLNVVVFVIATNGPLTALVGGVPAAITFGNGVGCQGYFLPWDSCTCSSASGSQP